MSSDAVSLLDRAAALLRETAPTLSGEGRYIMLLAANAIAIARRDVAAAPRVAKTDAETGSVAAAIRAGEHDDDAALHARLIASAVLRAWVTDPGSLTPAERAAVEAAP